MKKIAIILFLVCAAMQAQAQKLSLFDKLSNDKDVTTVFVSKALLSMMPSNRIAGMKGDFKDIANKLDQIEIYTTESKNVIKFIRNEITSLSQNKRYERIMQIKDDDESIVFLAERRGNVFKDFVMFLDDGDEYTVIRMVGTFTSNDIQKITKNSGKNRKN